MDSRSPFITFCSTSFVNINDELLSLTARLHRAVGDRTLVDY